MSDVRTVQDNWSQGMRRDHARDQLPPNSAWNAVDLVRNYGAPLRQRGAWKYHSQDISSVEATAASIRAGIYAVFATAAGGSTPKNLAFDEDGRLYDVTTAGAASSIGLTQSELYQNPVFHGGAKPSGAGDATGLVIIPHGDAAQPLNKYDGTSLTTIGNGCPTCRYAAVYKDYTVLGNGASFTHRVMFSPPGDPAGADGVNWDVTNSFIDFSQPVRGFGVTKNALLVWGDDQLSRIRGATPPPDTDMDVDDPWLKLSLFDAFGIAEHNENVYFCAREGVFRSDGVVFDDLTKKGGMLRYWLDLVKDATSTWTFAAGIIRDHLIISVMDGTTFKDAFLIDLGSYAWLRLANFDATSFWSGQLNAADELYWGRRNAARVCKTDTIFSKVGDSSHASDDDGDAVLIEYESAFREFGAPGLKRITHGYFGHKLVDHAGTNPTATVSFITTPDETSYTTAGTLTETTTYKRSRLPIGRKAPGVAVKITRTGAGDFQLWDEGYGVHALEPSRRAA